MSSKYLSPLQTRGVLKVGDAIIPGDGQFPRFSKTEFIRQIDRMLDYIPSDDRDGLCILMGVFACLPRIVILAIMQLSEWASKIPGLPGAPFRMIIIGVKGMILTLYYSKLEDSNDYGDKIYDLMDYHTSIKMEEDMTDVSNLKNLDTPSVADVEVIYKDAKDASIFLRKLSPRQRVNYIANLRHLILARKETIIDRIQQETGKSRSDALISEIFGILDYLEFLEKEAPKALMDKKVKTPIALMGKKSRIYWEPMGTMLIISPWNYPFYQAIVPICTSFVCGNATIYKPSEFTPLKGVVEQLLLDAGFQSDWVQVVYGDGKVGSALIDQRPDKIFFTGSVETGKKIMKQAAEQIIPVELELGGKDASIVFEDANLQRAAAGVAWGALTNLGQSCTSIERVYVQASIYEQFKRELLTQVKRVKQEVDSNGDADVGVMTTLGQVKIIQDQIIDAKNKGAVFLTGNEWDGESKNIPPMIIENVDRCMQIVSEETFGPTIPLIKFQDEAHAVEMANDSKFGLTASLWTADKVRADRVARALDVGGVSVNNVMLTEGNPYLPFGGKKLSGIGRYKGIEGLHGFCNLKSVLIDSNSAKIEANWYPYTQKKYSIFARLTDNAFAHGIMAFIRFAIYGLKLEGYSNKVGKTGR